MTTTARPEAVLPDLLEQSVRSNPGATAVLGAEGSLTYAQLQAQAMGLGAAILSLTTKPVVALFVPMCTPFPGAFLGCHYAGKAALPFNV